MKVIIAGSRDITDYDTVVDAITRSELPITEVVSGTARGVDSLGEMFAACNQIPVVQFRADWNRYNKAAGPIRNEQMGRYADAAIVVWDGKSTGSAHMAQFMKQLHKPLFLYMRDKNDNPRYHRYHYQGRHPDANTADGEVRLF